MLTVRDRKFAIDGAAVDAWAQAEPAAAAFYDSLSALFPQGERFFIDSVRHYRELATGAGVEEVRRFMAQEALHTREHVALNQRVAEAGGDVAALEARTKREIDAVRRRSPLVQLALTAALEHFTAVLAHQLIANPRHLAHAGPEGRRLWLWHAAEEIEHKCVAFDLLLAATADWSGLRRWAFRSRIFVEAIARMFRVMIPNYATLRRSRSGPALSEVELALFLLASPGLLRGMAAQLFAFFAPGFHPSQVEDDRLAELALAA